MYNNIKKTQGLQTMVKHSIYDNFFACDHPPELVYMMTNAIQKNILLATLIGSALYLVLFHEYIPFWILALWTTSQLVLSIARAYVARKLERFTKTNYPLQKRYLRISILGTALGAFIWGIGSWLTVLYTPVEYTYYMLAIVLGLTTGATSTLGSIFQAYLLFIWIVLLMLASSFFYYGDNAHFVIGIISLISITFLTSTGSDYYKKLREIVSLSIKLQDLNKNLEERVHKEVAKNIAKDIQLMHQSRLAQMGEMVSMIAHQWRQPLHIISTAATDMDLKIQLGTIDNNTCLNNINTINTLTQHLSATIDDFRDFFKVTKEKEETSIDEVVQVTLKIVKEYVENKKIAITVDLNSNERFTSFPNELKQVLINLLKNSEDALLENSIKNASIHVKTFVDEHHYNLEVSDNAGGIKPEVIKNIFDAYFTTKDDDKGTGLGLYMSKRIVEEHCAGHLSAHNTNEGACFCLRLPRESDKKGSGV